jgi:small subunit ribosomal protein S4
MLSEFGGQLQEKQKLQFSYGLREAQLARIFKEAVRRQGATGEVMLGFLERRLDNTLFRLGLAPSRSVGRQLVGHGHITVNGRKVSIPSYRIRVGDVIAIREQSREHPVFKDLGEALKNYTPPSWLLMDEVKLEGTVKALPHEFDTNIDVNMVVDYYSQ